MDDLSTETLLAADLADRWIDTVLGEDPALLLRADSDEPLAPEDMARNLAHFRAVLIEELAEQPIAYALDEDDDEDEDDDDDADDADDDDDDDDDDEEAGKPIKIGDIRDVLVELKDVTGKKGAAKEILKEFGYDELGDADPRDFKALMAAAQKALAKAKKKK